MLADRGYYYQGIAYLQGFTLAVQQLGDVPCHSLYQVLGVVSLDLKLALLLIINLQMEKHRQAKVMELWPLV